MFETTVDHLLLAKFLNEDSGILSK